jgi:hypothetical protein
LSLCSVGLRLDLSSGARRKLGVNGSIADASAVTVIETNSQTGIPATLVSNETSTRNFVGVQQGIYKLTASLPGLQSQIFNNHQVEAGVQLR